jgi:hypothetical protein
MTDPIEAPSMPSGEHLTLQRCSDCSEDIWWDNTPGPLCGDCARGQLARLTEERDRLRGLYGDMVNQFALCFLRNGVEIVTTGGLSDLEAAFEYFKLPDPCTLVEFRAALASPEPAKGTHGR